MVTCLLGHLLELTSTFAGSFLSLRLVFSCQLPEWSPLKGFPIDDIIPPLEDWERAQQDYRHDPVGGVLVVRVLYGRRGRCEGADPAWEQMEAMERPK